jgi:hypothetical protein
MLHYSFSRASPSPAERPAPLDRGPQAGVVRVVYQKCAKTHTARHPQLYYCATATALLLLFVYRPHPGWVREHLVDARLEEVVGGPLG